MTTLFALIKKDLLLELRSKETLAVMIFLSLLMAIVLSLGIQSAFLSSANTVKLFPGLLWFVFVVTASIAMGRSFEYEVTHRAGEGILLTGVSPAILYLSKVASSVVSITIGFAAGVISLGVLLDIPLSSLGVHFLLISLLTIIGYAALSTIVAAITSTARLKNVLLPLLLLPMLFPLFLGAVELTTIAVNTHTISYSSYWFTLLIALDLVYLCIGIATYDAVLRE